MTTLRLVATEGYYLTLPIAPLVRFDEVPVEEGNALVEAWGHDLGPCNRPFGMQAFTLCVGQEPVSVAISASTASSTAAGRSRYEIVELARLCTRPKENGAFQFTGGGAMTTASSSTNRT